jgi:Lrp/AsnC family transcriptional regulator, leucine-responsive regulatory protein
MTPETPSHRRCRFMDEKDNRLLALLRRDARSSLVSLARDLGLSRSATQERLRKLLASRVIEGFTTVEGTASPTSQIAHLQVKLDQGKTCAMVVPRLRKLPALRMMHSIAGPYDLLIRVEASTIAGIEAARSTVASTAGVAEVSTMVVMQRHIG